MRSDAEASDSGADDPVDNESLTTKEHSGRRSVVSQLAPEKSALSIATCSQPLREGSGTQPRLASAQARRYQQPVKCLDRQPAATEQPGILANIELLKVLNLVQLRYSFHLLNHHPLQAPSVREGNAEEAKSSQGSRVVRLPSLRSSIKEASSDPPSHSQPEGTHNFAHVMPESPVAITEKQSSMAIRKARFNWLVSVSC